MTWRLAAAAGLVAALVPSAGAVSPLRLEVRPEHFGFVGTDVEVRVHVTRSDRPRALTVEIDSEHLYRASAEDLPPGAAPVRPSIWIRRAPAGHYGVVAVLLDERGRACAREAAATEILGRR